jgi:hypothetical protein
VSDPLRAQPAALLERVATTLVVPALVLLAGRIPLAYVDPAAVARMKTDVSPLAVGITPFLTAYGLIELAALVVPRWRRARHQAHGRRWLERASNGLALLLALAQSFGIAMSFESADLVVVPGPMPRVVHTATLVGGACAVALAARWLTRRGLVNGYVLLCVLPVVLDLLQGQAFRNAVVQGGPRNAVLLAVALLVAIAATAVAVAGGDAIAAALRKGESAYRGGQSAAPRAHFAVPVSAIAPLTVTAALLKVPALVAPWKVPGMRELATLLSRSEGLYEVAHVAILLLMTLAAAALVNRPREVVAFVRRLGAADEEGVGKDERRAFRCALAPTVAYLFTLAVASQAANELSSGLPTMVGVALATAVAIDLGRSLLAHVQARDLVCVAEEHDAYAVAALRAALAGEGIDVRPRGMAVLSLMQAFAPYAPVELHVRTADVERATALLRHWAAGEAKPAAPPGVTAPADGRAPSSPIAKTAALVALAAVAVAVRHVPPLEKPPARRADVAILRVDDAADPLNGVRESEAPEGVSVYAESVPLGKGPSQRRSYARVSPGPGESNEAAWARVLPWLKTFELPAGDRWTWQEVTEPEEQEEGAPLTLRVVGLRTLVVRGEPVVTTADIESAVVKADQTLGYDSVGVLVTLGAAGAERFHEATREWVGRRLAIVVDGRVNSAPVVRSPIGAGRVTITMGTGSLDSRLTDARTLAAALR